MFSIRRSASPDSTASKAHPALAAAGRGRLAILRRRAAIAASVVVLAVAAQLISPAAYADDRWNGPYPLGGIVTSGVDAASDGAGRYHVFARGADNALWFRLFDSNAGWRNWQSLGKPFGQDVAGEPAAVSDRSSRMTVFVPLASGTVAGISSVYWGDWGSWQDLGGDVQGGLDAASRGVGHFDVMARSRTDGQLVHMVYGYDGPSWTTTPYQIPLTSDPSLVALPGGALQVFARDSANGMRSQLFIHGEWGSWLQLPVGGFSSAPAAVAQQDRTDVFAVGWSGAMYQSTQRNGVWSGWQQVPGVYTADPGAASFAPGRLDVFGRGQNNGVWQVYAG